MVFARLNRWLIDRLPSRRAATARVTVTSKGLTVEDNGKSRLIPWDTIERVVAFRSDQVVGTSIGLVFGLAGGGAFTVTDDSPAWQQLTDKMTEVLPGAKRYATWGLEIVSSPSGEVEVFRR